MAESYHATRVTKHAIAILCTAMLFIVALAMPVRALAYDPDFKAPQSVDESIPAPELFAYSMPSEGAPDGRTYEAGTGLDTFWRIADTGRCDWIQVGLALPGYSASMFTSGEIYSKDLDWLVFDGDDTQLSADYSTMTQFFANGKVSYMAKKGTSDSIRLTHGNELAAFAPGATVTLVARSVVGWPTYTGGGDYWGHSWDSCTFGSWSQPYSITIPEDYDPNDGWACPRVVYDHSAFLSSDYGLGQAEALMEIVYAELVMKRSAESSDSYPMLFWSSPEKTSIAEPDPVLFKSWWEGEQVYGQTFKWPWMGSVAASVANYRAEGALEDTGSPFKPLPWFTPDGDEGGDDEDPDNPSETGGAGDSSEDTNGSSSSEATDGNNTHSPVPPLSKPASVKAKAGKKAATVSWQVSRFFDKQYYQVSYTTGKAKAKTMKASKTKVAVKGLKKGKTYTFKVRVVWKDPSSGKTHYSKWSKAVKAKIKR